MNLWLQKSLELASNQNYYDQLHAVYPIATEDSIERNIDEIKWRNIENSFKEKNDIQLIKDIFNLTKTGKFPFKSSYVRYFYRAQNSNPNFFINNPNTIKILASRLYNQGLESIKIEITKGAETNQTQGQSFLNYLKVTDLPVDKLNYNSFKNTNSNAVLIASDKECKQIAEEFCNYTGTKGLDFVARINNKFIVGEAKFISDYGGNQDKSLLDAKTLLSKTNFEKVIIIDGVCFMKSKHSLYKTITNELRDENVLSALLLNDFLKFKLNET